MKKILLYSALFCSAISFGQIDSPIYRTTLYNGDFTKSDPITLEEIETGLFTSATGEIEGILGVAVQPCSGIPYVIYKVESNRYFGTIDLNTNIISEISILDDQFATLTFGEDYDELFAITGNGASVPETLYSVDITTGATTMIAGLSAESDGEALSFSPETGKLYRWSGWGEEECVMHEIDPTTFVETNIPLSGYGYSNVGGATYIGDNQFMVTDISDISIFKIGTDGFATDPVISFDDEEKILFKRLRYIATEEDVICAGESVLIEATNGDSYEWFIGGVSTGISTNSIEATAGGTYSCLITIDTCSYFSNSIEITEIDVPVTEILTNAGTEICIDDSLLITANEGADEYRWYLDGVLIAGENNDSIYVTDAGDYTMSATYSTGCSDSTDIATVLTISACDASIAKSEKLVFDVYPNPTTGVINISYEGMTFSGELKVEVLTLDGKVEEVIVLNEGHNIDLSNLSNGNYILRITSEEEVFSTRIVKR